jgi:hypothetical protein
MAQVAVPTRHSHSRRYRIIPGVSRIRSSCSRDRMNFGVSQLANTKRKTSQSDSIRAF